MEGKTEMIDKQAMELLSALARREKTSKATVTRQALDRHFRAAKLIES